MVEAPATWQRPMEEDIMTRTHITSRLLLASGLLFGAVAAHAAGGFSVTPAEEGRVSPGMDRAAVQQALGRPEINAQYLNEPGRTWSYQVISTENKLFDVDFSANGRVLSTSERVQDDRN